MSTEHSPTPWEVDPHYPDAVVDADGRDVCDCHAPSHSEEESIANAAFIVVAGNAHDDLVEALLEAPVPESADLVAWLHEYSRWYHGERAAAIRKAKEG